MIEEPLVFNCGDASLVGILHRTESAAATGLLLVVGGPQYRVGSHRQFVLLARYLAEQGIPVLRFDYRSMGDSDGDEITFEQTQQDIHSAVDEFQQRVDGLKNVIIWGLCDAVSAALFYGYQDERVKGLVLLNPWVRTVEGEARAYIKHYYLRRVVSVDFWRKLLGGKFNVAESARSFFELLGKMFNNRGNSRSSAAKAPGSQTIDPGLSLPDRMLQGLEFFNGKVLLILSGSSDYVANEFRDVVSASSGWTQLLSDSRVSRKDLREADHTFSTQAWRSQVESWTLEWIRKNF